MANGERDMSAVPDVGDEDQVKPKIAKGKLDRQEEIQQLYDLLENYRFRKFLWEGVLARCNINSRAPLEGLERFEGRRDVGLELIEEVWTANPEAFTMMMLEAESRKQGSTVSHDTSKKKGKK